MGASIIQLPAVHDERGNLTFVESARHAPFELKRIYYVYGVPAGEARAGHAHKTLHQLLIAVAGSFDVTIDDGTHRQVFHLDHPEYGLHIPPMHWRLLENFSAGAVCLALASDFYSEADYIREHDDFTRLLQAEKAGSAPETRVKSGL